MNRFNMATNGNAVLERVLNAAVDSVRPVF
jgi:hypothetical protein